MSKEKQIEEILMIIDDVACGNIPEDECYVKDSCAYCRAERLYNAGYRKQSEGEWIWKKKIEPQAQNRLYCSVCDDECLSKNNYYVKSNFCPNCGARMKGV